MNLHLIRGGNKSDLDDKKYNIGIGISLGNKWFTLENIVGLTKWSLSHTKDFVVIYLADSIHAINLEVRNRIEYENALKKAEDKGSQLLNDIQSKITESFSTEEKNKIILARWNDLLNPDFIKKRDYLYSLYTKDAMFRDRIYQIVREFTSHEKRIFASEDVHRLGTYIIEELPEIICRVPIKGKIYDANAYPFDSGVTKLAEEIQMGLSFPDIKKQILDSEPKVLLEVR